MPSKLKVVFYIVLPLVIIILVVKEFLLKVKIDTAEMLHAGIGIIALMWIGFIILNRLLHKEFNPQGKSFQGFQIAHKDKTADSVPKPIREKFFSSGRFQIIHKGRSLGASSDEQIFKVPTYPSPKAPPPETKKVNFGTAGIRGLTNIEITPLLVLKMSEVFGAYLVEKNPVSWRAKIAVGYDSRYGSEMLARAAISGLNSTGINTTNCGCITTGGLASYTVSNRLDAGILLTGSHTPYNMTGFIIISADGSYLDMETSRELENRFVKYEHFRKPVKPEDIGTNIDIKDANNYYKTFLLSHINPELIRPKKFSVLFDPANGPAGLIFPDILKELGCEVFLINEKLSAVPERPSEPRAKNLTQTVLKVKEHLSDIGIATDVDADRVLFIDAQGNVLSEDLVGALFASDIISRDKTCVTPINSSLLIEEVISQSQGRLKYCRIGQPETIKVIKQYSASFSYEESGKYYFCGNCLWPDALLSSLKLLEIMAKHNKSLSQIAQTFPQFYQIKHTLSYEALGLSRKPDLDNLFNKIQDVWSKEYTEGRLKDITIDGLKRVYQDKSWLLIRKSGTEPLLRIYADAMSLERAETLVKQGEEIVKKAIS
jgi:phosphomannomutase/phosphoglucomutase